jgi:endonuclease/exonuclease/phosphatase family metal-dependent hydrolase
LRCNQLGEILEDVSQHVADTEVVVAGDFNADLRQEPFISAIGKVGLSIPFDRFSELPTTVISRFNGPRTIDWILTKGPLVPSEQHLHESIQASDHYPLSFILFGRPHDVGRGRNNE